MPVLPSDVDGGAQVFQTMRAGQGFSARRRIGKSRGFRCYQSAMERKIACEQGGPLPRSSEELTWQK